MALHDATSLRRRRFLRGLGACLALPFLDSLMPRGAKAGPDTNTQRLLYYYVPNGFDAGEVEEGMNVPPAAWTDIKTTLAGGALSTHATLPRFLKPLSSFSKKLLIVSGLDNAPGNHDKNKDEDSNGAHFQQTASFLTCKHVDKAPFSAGQSIDQVVAKSFGYKTPHRSLQLGLHPGDANSACGSGWPCAYLGFISWADATTPLAQLNDPYEVFTTLFATNGGAVSKAEFERRRARKLKVLDVVKEDAKSLLMKLGANDRHKLDQYLTAVNEAEDKANAMATPASCDEYTLNSADWTYPEKLDLMADLMALAFKCDLTRVITFMRHAGGSSFGDAYDWVEHEGKALTAPKHHYSHWQSPNQDEPGSLAEKVQGYRAKVEAINTWELERFAYLLAKLDEFEEPNGKTVLENSIVMFGSELGDPNLHLANDLPIVIAGSGGGVLVTNRHLTYNAQVPMGQTKSDTFADLHLALAASVGVPLPQPMENGVLFGEDGTKALTGLGA